MCLLSREFARWKVRNTAIERRDLVRHPVPLMPEFQRSIRLLGRRPTTQQFIDTIIKKYGTHLLISATLGGRSAAAGLSPCRDYGSGLEGRLGCPRIRAKLTALPSYVIQKHLVPAKPDCHGCCGHLWTVDSGLRDSLTGELTNFCGNNGFTLELAQLGMLNLIIGLVPLGMSAHLGK